MYNTQHYVRECLLSVTGQTYRNLEIIVVDDGSVDASVKICEELRKQDGRIQILRQKNHGVSSARNAGLCKASGEYVFFMDSDDVIHPQLLETLLAYAKIYSADLLFCTYIKFQTVLKKPVIDGVYCNPGKLLHDIGTTSAALRWFHKKYAKELSCIGGKLIKRSIIGKGRFDERLAYGEDTVFLYCLCRKRVRMFYLDAAWYYYRIHSKSATGAAKSILRKEDFRAYRIIRDSEMRRGNTRWAVQWEYRYMWRLLSEYPALRIKGKEESRRLLKGMITAERKNPLYQNLPIRTRVLFGVLYFGCVYISPARELWLMKQKSLFERRAV